MKNELEQKNEEIERMKMYRYGHAVYFLVISFQLMILNILFQCIHRREI